MRILLLLLLLIIAKFSIAQIGNTNFDLVDKEARAIKSKSVFQLAKKLTEPYKTEIEKVRSIFIWITQNIRYDIKGAADPAGLYHDLPKSIVLPADSIPRDEYNYRVVQKVLNEKQAICDGYARLFKTLCDNSNIKSEIVTGNIRWYSDPVGEIGYSAHAWNAVWIDDKWYLLDPTWASGNSNGAVFSKQYNNFYFLTEPEKFINDHLPYDSKWTLLKNPPSLQEFFNTIYISENLYSSNIISYQPGTDVIEGTIENNKVKFELETDDINKQLNIIEYPQDTIRHDPNNELSFLKEINKPHISKSEIEEKKIYLYHYSSSCTARQIFVYYNGKLVLCYGIKRTK